MLTFDIYALLKRVSSKKSLIGLFFISHSVFLVMMVYTFPIIHEQIGTMAFDMATFGYDMQEAQRIVEALDPATTRFYLFPQLTLLDLLYPVLLALFLGGLLVRMMVLLDVDNRLSCVLIFIPFLGMTFDYLENICIVLMITNTVDLSEAFVRVSSTFTILKGLCTTVAWMALLVYFFCYLFKKHKGNVGD